MTHEQLEEALEKHTKDLEWEWTEMYDKISKLHLRLSKRDKRSQEPTEQEQLELNGRVPPSVRAHYMRRIG